jgi:hypothetical protein
VAISVEMLSGRRKRDYEADSLAAQAEGETSNGDTNISPGEAAEVGVMTAADGPAEEGASADDASNDEVLVLA